MNIWLVTIGEPLPVGISATDRLHRTGQLADFLASQGHDVVWWTSTFDHFRKQHHFDVDTTVEVTRKFKIRLLKGSGYSHNISIGRIRDHAQVTHKFARHSTDCNVPDIIVSALPTIDLSNACVEYGLSRGIPVILDMRDMWPDIFVDILPRILRPVGRLLLYPLYTQAYRAFSRATAIIGITDQFVDWGLQRGRRKRGLFDRAFPIAYQLTPPPNQKLAEAERFWANLGVVKNQVGLTICYFGSMGAQLNLTHVIEAGRILKESGYPIRLVLCGTGERLQEYRKRAQYLPNVLLPGWVDGAHIWSLMQRSSAGLDPLPDRYDFIATINNKAVEYLSAGLPIISSPRHGVLYDLLANVGCGLSYSTGSAYELVSILKRLYSEPDALSGMSLRARILFNDNFKSDVVHSQLSRYLSEVVAYGSIPRRIVGAL